MQKLKFKSKLLLVVLLLSGSILNKNITNATTTSSINFAGYDWNVKSGTGMGPGKLNVGNNWSNDIQDVFLDEQNRLHLKVSQHSNEWYSSEVYLATSSLGYGKYTFDIDSRLDLLDKNLVAAPFLYQDDTHEIDIEHSYWSNTTTATNLYYTVQPFDKVGNQQTQHLDLSDTTFQDIIYWEPNKITLSTEQNGNSLATWTYTSSTNGTSNNFTPGNEKVHINFWQYQSLAPLDASSTNEFIIKNFTFEQYIVPTSTPTSTPITTSTSTTSTPTSTTTTNNSGGGNGGGGSGSTNTSITIEKINDTVDKLIAFLKSKQEVDGKISDTSTADWAAMSFGSKGIYASDIKNGDKSLYDFIYNIKIEEIEKENNKCAGYSRHILALLSAGTQKTDPKIIELKNKLDTTCVQNNIFGLAGINDDIFGLLAVLALDDSPTSPTVIATLNGIKTDQKINGAFTSFGSDSADITGAAINALKYAQSKGITISSTIFTSSTNYLKNSQLPDGGWCYDIAWCNNTSDALTTSWAVMGINALGQTQNDWFNSVGKNPWHILINLDGVDHYFSAWDSNGVDWFATKHAIPALLGKTWPIILDPKPVINNQNNGGGSAASQSTATTTLTTTSTLISTTTITTSTSTTSTLSIISTTTPTVEIVTNTTSTTTIKKEEEKPRIISSRNSEIKKTFATSTTNNASQTTITKPQQELTAGKPQIIQNKTLDNLPLDTPTKRTAKKILAISGGSILVVGAYLGLRLLKNVI